MQSRAVHQRCAVLIVLVLNVVACTAADTPDFGERVRTVYWSDGDSGRIDGERFRLANVDAPETGGVGARGGAKCEKERALGYKAKAFMVELTRDVDLRITHVHGMDRYDRQVVELSANCEDIARARIAAGRLGAWPHKGQRSLAPKPRWCPEQ